MALQIEIMIGGQLPSTWGGTFTGMEVVYQGNGTTRLSGQLPDQAALYGLLMQLRDYGLELVSFQATNLKSQTRERESGPRIS